MPEFRIGKALVGPQHPTFIIAEAGINHQGDIEIAKRLIDVAVLAGASAVKFQKRTTEAILTKEGLQKPYDNPVSFGKTYGEHRRALELSEEAYRALMAYATERNISFLASGWDERAVDFLDRLGVGAFKVASADLTNTPLLEHTARKGKPVLLSTGMANMDDVVRALEVVRAINKQVAILQCTSTYPCPFDDIHLNVIPEYIRRFPECVIGYSGHELGISLPIAAVALGARIVERHFTLDRTMKGNDHAASLEPDGLRKLVRDIRALERALGRGEKRILPTEIPVREKLAKSLVSAVQIPKGAVIKENMLTAKSPGTGIPPYRHQEFVGRKARVDIPEDATLKEEFFE